MRPAVRMETEHEMEMVEARMAEMVTETVTVKVNRPLVTVTVKVSTTVLGMAVRKARAKQAMMVRGRGKIMSMAVSSTTTTTMVTARSRDPTTEWYLMKERSEARTATAMYSQDYYCCCWAPPRMYSEACNRKGPKTRRHRSRLCSSPW